MKNNHQEYSSDSASHYRAYRPPLHRAILDRCLAGQEAEKALDVGCGIGHSSVALTKYCRQVLGYDPSEPMIRQALPHQQVTYTSNPEELGADFNLMVFFGSLFYIQENSIPFYLGKLSPGGRILCCDFKVLFEPVIRDLNLSVAWDPYDHTKNLDSFTPHPLTLVHSEQFEVEFTCSLEELTHLILSESSIKTALQKKLPATGLFGSTRSELKKIYTSQPLPMKAELFYSQYRK